MRAISALCCVTLYLTNVAASSQNRAAAAVDRNFAMNAAMGNTAEVQLGQLAQEKGSSDFTRQFGAMMAKEHGIANDELERIAGRKSIKLPTKLNGKQQATYDHLSRLSGSSFDSAYRTAMIRDHEEGIKNFNAYLRKSRDAELRAYAQKSMQTKKRHLQIARAGRMPVSSLLAMP